jgi:hypothetical protein
MSVASQLSFGNAAVLTTGTLSGDRGVSAGSATTSFIEYNASTSTPGQFDSSATTPSATNRLNYNGNLYVTNLYTTTLVGNLVGSFANGTSNISIPASNGNVNIVSAGNTTLVITGTGTNVTGTLNVTGNLVTGGAVVSRVTTIADGTTVTMNGDTTDLATQTNTQAAGTLVINAITGTPFNGQRIMFRLQSANVQTFSWNAVFGGSTDTPLPTASSGSNKYDYMGFIYNSTAIKWQLLAKNFGY